MSRRADLWFGSQLSTIFSTKRTKPNKNITHTKKQQICRERKGQKKKMHRQTERGQKKEENKSQEMNKICSVARFDRSFENQIDSSVQERMFDCLVLCFWIMFLASSSFLAFVRSHKIMSVIGTGLRQSTRIGAYTGSNRS